MASDKLVCGGCHNHIEDRRFLLCGGCKQHYDLDCANVSEQRFYNTLTKEHKAAWRCVLCKSKQPKSDNSNTPVRAASEGITLKRGAAVNSPTELDNMSIVEVLNDTASNITIEMVDFQAFVSEMRSFRQEMRDELRANRMEIRQLNDTVVTLSGRVDVCEVQIKKMDERINELELRLNKERTNSSLSASIEHLKAELNERDQDLLLNDVEISCIQVQKGENLLNLLTVLARKLGMDLAEQDIVSATRVGRAPERESVDQSPSTSRPRPIVVRLARRAVRDQLMQAARVRRGATTEGTGIPGASRRFYINERLTRVNRLLFRRARELGGRLNWRFVWTRDGRIFVRQFQGNDAPRLRIRTEEDLIRVFGSDAVSASNNN